MFKGFGVVPVYIHEQGVWGSTMTVWLRCHHRMFDLAHFFIVYLGNNYVERAKMKVVNFEIGCAVGI